MIHLKVCGSGESLFNPTNEKKIKTYSGVKG